jgi:hypothetical protein
MGRHHDIDISAVLFQQTQDLEGFEGGNPSGNSQNRFDAMQWHNPSRRALPPVSLSEC